VHVVTKAKGRNVKVVFEFTLEGKLSSVDKRVCESFLKIQDEDGEVKQRTFRLSSTSNGVDSDSEPRTKGRYDRVRRIDGDEMTRVGRASCKKGRMKVNCANKG
jgi:hypothetical protein